MMDLFVVHFTLGVILFFLINWVGRHSFSMGYMEITLFIKDEEAPAINYLIRVLSPIVYLIIVSSILYLLKLDKYVINIYLVNIYYISFRLFFNVITSRGPLLNWGKQVIYWVSIILLSYLVYDKIIKYRVNVLPDFTTIANELWIIILVFIFQIVNGVKLSSDGQIKRKTKYLKSKYLYFKVRYGNIISQNTRNDSLEIIAYAILIYEDFNRPIVARWLEYVTFFITGSKHSLGVMQFPTDKFITDLQSVDLGTKKLRNKYNSILAEIDEKPEIGYSIYDAEREIIGNYNGGSKYYNEIMQLSNSIKEQFYSGSIDTLLPLTE
ncbi:hypothetical protein [Pedobacter sp. GR22-10]|uniref:hypothetical protein n=1 Tax=Pedobacter sp. GR22-10 TaxID=2994472 RepID=UPI002246A76E|nr:hypothetical protein [Pedobacter sp. GR22-10]MCX2432831.1 hypothetical protein [Pedobacter sp. GR22-10]